MKISVGRVPFDKLRTVWLGPDRYQMECKLCGERFGGIYNHPSACFQKRPDHKCKEVSK